MPDTPDWNTQPTQPQPPFSPVSYERPAEPASSAGGDPSPAPPPRRAKRGVSRRAVLIGAGVGAGALGVAGAGVGVYLSRQGASATFGGSAQQINHLLRRAGFGPTPGDLDTYLQAGVQGSIDRLVNYTRLPDTVTQKLQNEEFDFTRADELGRWFLMRMLYTTRPLEEKLTLFWHGALTSSYRKIGGKQGYDLLVQQNNLLRAKCMGRFDDLIHAISIDPAMLWWLDGRLSTGSAPNENYARELMELFTMGIGNYTQDDVHNGALALTGWRVLQGKAVFVERNHYSGTVTYLGQTGKLGLDDVVRLVCAHPHTGAFIARRMWSFFVYENPAESDLKPLVDAYYQHDHSIGAMVHAMFSSPLFFSEKAYRARVKSPTEFLIGALRAHALEVDGKTLPGALALMGQTLFDPPDVSGWDGDKVSANWLSTQTWMARVNFINTLVAAVTGAGAGKGAASADTTNAKSAQQAAFIPTSFYVGASDDAGEGSAPVAGYDAGALLTAQGTGGSALQSLINARQFKSADDLLNYFVTLLLDDQLDASRRAILHEALTQGGAAATGDTLTLSGGAKLSAASARQMLYLLMSLPEYVMN